MTCPRCGGTGADPEWEPECCGNVNSAGECRGDCVVPVQVPCRACGGRGEIEATDKLPNIIDARDLRPPRRVTADGTHW